MELMTRYEDNHFDLAIVDPPYGIGADKASIKPAVVKQNNGSLLKVKQSKFEHKNWDDNPPEHSYFNELIRVSKNQIIWGVNYFDYSLTGGRIVWNKFNETNDQYGCEIAYCSLNNRTDIVHYLFSGMMQGKTPSFEHKIGSIQMGDKRRNEKRIHPTQKPVKLYEWLLMNYAKKGDRILDTHLGSGSIALACHNLGFHLTACELDAEYFNAAMARIKQHQAQKRLF